ncbi:UDP-glucose--hexose-1-phosphate uridylyltransferase [Enterococcus sp. BWR-S5]|uniref:UDP-glucose--hexose-1-phosphate uridylyltransferase n=1 Tax=Enterococcus sp. BWR-S5 TaxID=2787714 RepID=UPI00192132AB|nr:UDP-glucose--hexose-1-phosphate uridylyltransferase [Enterococcus sp. BWR-S5]MBL1227373.1 UDP-glucose--hexose-1-phosphate uridylyltransferase [Enterococcus sp. BWR-S5]
MKLKQLMDDFITLAIQSGGWMEMDRLYLRNKLLMMIGGHTPDSDYEAVYDSTSADSLADSLVAYAVEMGYSNEQAAKSYLKSQLLDLLAPPPSVVNAFFAQHYSKSSEEATNYFYELNKRDHYIYTPQVGKKEHYETPYGEFVIQTLEDENAGKAREADCFSAAGLTEYPKCTYCFENEGYGEEGSAALPTRRLIRMNVGGESWGFQFSDWEEYKEKFFISSEAHQGLTKNKDSVARVTQLLDIFPQYFILLSPEKTKEHGYYEGGRESFPIAAAAVRTYIELKEFPLMNVGSLDWPFPVIRLQSPNAEDIIEGIDYILQKWQQCYGEKLSVEPMIIGRKKENLYEFDLLLTSGKQPNEERATAEYLGRHSLSPVNGEESIAENQLSEKALEEYVAMLKSWTPFGMEQQIGENETIEDFLLSLE